MPGRTQHPTTEMLRHAHALQTDAALLAQRTRLKEEIAEKRAHLKHTERAIKQRNIVEANK